MIIRNRRIVLAVVLILSLVVWVVVQKKSANPEFSRFDNLSVGFDVEYPTLWQESKCFEGTGCVLAFNSGNISVYATTTSVLRKAEFSAVDYAIGSNKNREDVSQFKNTYGVRFFYFDVNEKNNVVRSDYFFDTPKGDTVRIVAANKTPEFQAFINSISFE